MFVDLSLLPISENFDGKVTFNKETAGFLNTLGMYTVKENGDIGRGIAFEGAALNGMACG